MSLVIDREFDSVALAAASASGFQRPPTVEAGHWLVGLLDQIDYGLVVLDEAAAALHVNRSAREWLASAAAPLRIRCGRVEAVAPQDSGQFRHALAGAVSRGWRALLAFGEGNQGVAAALGPMPGASDETPGLALLVIGRRQVCDALTAQFYASRHGLTSAESQVLQLLCTGLAPREIARRQRVALSTVRTQIGSIRSKTQARTIGALVREVSLLPPLGHALSASTMMALN
jgi:DNA-binding CsgD family transcriptional regulator